MRWVTSPRHVDASTEAALNFEQTRLMCVFQAAPAVKMATEHIPGVDVAGFGTSSQILNAYPEGGSVRIRKRLNGPKGWRSVRLWQNL